MKKLTALLLAVAATALVSVGIAGASMGTKWTAALSAGQEIPKQTVKAPNAHGLFKATLDGTKLKWKLTFAKLSGPAVAAHIHIGKKGVAGGVAVALCQPCASGVSGTATLTGAQVAQLKKRLFYVNVHTAKNPGGEIRGQISAG